MSKNGKKKKPEGLSNNTTLILVALITALGPIANTLIKWLLRR